MPLSIKEVTDALNGAVSFILWFFAYGADFCNDILDKYSGNRSEAERDSYHMACVYFSICNTGWNTSAGVSYSWVVSSLLKETQ